MMKGNINLISYDCYQQATEKQLAGLKWKENRVYYISEIHNEKMQDEIYGYIDDRCRRLSLSTVVNDIYRFDLLKEFLNEKCTSCSSITDKKWEELERSYKAFLYKDINSFDLNISPKDSWSIVRACMLEEIDRIGGMLSNKVALRFLF